MDIAVKYKIVEKIIQSNDDKVLDQIKTLLDISEPDFWDELPTGVKEAIDQAREQLDNGKGIALEKLWQM